MLDFGIFEMRTDVFLLILSVVCVTVQVLLCTMARSVFVRLLPVAFFACLTVLFFSAMPFFDDWDRVGFLFLALWSAVLLGACGIGWGVWAIVKAIRARKKPKATPSK